MCAHGDGEGIGKHGNGRHARCIRRRNKTWSRRWSHVRRGRPHPDGSYPARMVSPGLPRRQARSDTSGVATLDTDDKKVTQPPCTTLTDSPTVSPVDITRPLPAGARRTPYARARAAPGPMPGQQPGYPPHGQAFHMPPQPPPKRFTGPIIALVSLALVAAIGIVTLLVVNLTGDDEPDTTTASPSESVDPEPTSEEPSEPPTTDTATESSRISEAEFGDWDFSFGDVSLQAAKKDGWSYEDCSPPDVRETLVDHGCSWPQRSFMKRRTAAFVFRRCTWVSRPRHRHRSGDRSHKDDFTPHDDAFVDGYEFGRWRSEAAKSYVVIVSCTATNAVDEDSAQQYLDNLHWDLVAALSFRM